MRRGLPASLCANAHAAHAPLTAPPDFARVFGLDDDLYLHRLVELFDTTGSGSISLAEFLGGRSRRAPHPHHARPARRPSAPSCADAASTRRVRAISWRSALRGQHQHPA